MSLTGTLDTFPLPDVLRFLASGAKTGRLGVNGPRGGGDVWLEDGQIVAAETADTTEAVDAVFNLLREPEGGFDFDAEMTRSDKGDPADVETILSSAETRLDEWKAIEAVVPSLDAAVALAPDLPGGAVRIESVEWQTVVAVSQATSVGEVGTALDLGEFDVSRAIKDLVERGLVTVGDAGDTTSAPAASKPKTKPAKAKAKAAPTPEPNETVERSEDAEAAFAAVAEMDAEQAAEVVRQLSEVNPSAAKAVEAAANAATPEERAAALAEMSDDEDPVDRGLLLKFLSSVRT